MTGPHLFQLARRAALVNGGGDAIAFGGKHATWRETLAAMEGMAAGLAGLGVKQGERVAVLSANSDAYVHALFAIPRLRAISAPLNIRLTLDEMAAQAKDAGARVLLADDTFAAQAAQMKANGVVETVVGLGGPQDGFVPLASLTPGALPDEGHGDEVVCLLYTGGTTGRPKGVMHTSATLVANAYQSADILGSPQAMRFIHVAPLFHIGAVAYVAAVTLHAGMHIPLPAFDPDAVLRAIAGERATHVTLVPTMINRVLNTPTFKDHDLSSLRRVIYGASPIPEALLTQAIAALPHVEFGQSYGQTETVTITVLTAERHVLSGPLAGKLKSAGAPAMGVDVRIVKPDGEAAARGELGEVLAKSDSVMVGYWNQPEATAATLRDGWVHTGDIGFMDEDGCVTVVDRMKDMIISGGENIYSVEVEDAIFKHPAVAECAVIALPHPEWGERVHAVVRVREGMALGGDELIEHCRGLIATYKCPRSVSFSATPLPLSGAGKVLKREIRDAMVREMQN